MKAFFFCPTSTQLGCAEASIVSQVLDQATFNLEANKKYTILHYGFAKAGATPQKRLMLIEDAHANGSSWPDRHSDHQRSAGVWNR